MYRSRKFVRGGPTSNIFFSLMRGGWIQINFGGPISARQRNAIEMAFPWRADNGPTLNAGLVAL